MDISRVKIFVKQITEGMYNFYDYKIEDLSSIEGIFTPRALSKKHEDGTKTIIVFMKINNSIYDEVLETNLCSKMNCKADEIIKIILIFEDKESVEIQNQLNSIGNSKFLQNNSIILDLVSRNIQISDNRIEPIANEIATVMDNTTKNKKKPQSRKNAPVTYALIGINVFMFIISVLLSGTIMDIDINVLVTLGAKYNYAIVQGQWFRLITCMFLHGGLIHIAANMYSLYSIGPLIEDLYGKYKYLTIYFVTGIISSLFSFFFSPTSISIGASGAIFGLLGVILVFAIKERERIGKGFFMNIASIIAINLFITLGVPGIDKFAHLGGLLSGVALGIIMKLNRD